ncbi:MAG: ABC transporter ATP-binding protein [Clostridiales bacterium]|nr:ABC transporter ATP-binding protein [Clostridiales bacterium]MDY5513509.1 ABC transporter ATP-binding protein [Candidatus Ventricola sp.]
MSKTQETEKRSARATFLRLGREIGSYRRDALLSPMFTVFCVILEILIPYLTASIIDNGISVGDMGHVARVGALMALMAVLAMICGVEAGRHSAQASTGFAANLRDAMFKNIQTFSFSNIDKFSTAGLVTRLTTDVTNMQNAFQMILMVCTRAPVTLAVALFMAFKISARLSLIFLTVMALLIAAIVILMPMAMRYFKQMFKKYDAVNAAVKENVGAIRVVKAFVREAHEDEKFTLAADDLYSNSISAERIVSFMQPIMMGSVYLCILLLSWLGAQMIVGRTGLTTGQLTSLLSYVMNILMSLMMLSMVFVMVTQSMAAAQRVEEVLDERADIASPESPVTAVADGSIDFEHVDFAYRGGKNVLSGVDLHIASGETIGILGGTGSSKSSLVSLISRLYDVTGGCVKVGGVDVRRYDIETLRDEVSVVLQKNVLFSGTILENLRWGDEQATEEQCREACRLACADEFISRFPDGYNTRIERGGTNVSGGQKQRLCIARALLKRPKVLILDDSTSAVDTATDARIRAALRTHIPGTTKLIIAQRIASVEDADRVLVLDEGRVAAFDTPENLLKTCPIYQEVYNSQVGSGGGDFDEASLRDDFEQKGEDRA